MRLTLEERAGWLLAGLDNPGWLRDLTAEERQVMASALAGLYKLAGVDIMREQLASYLLPALPGADGWTQRAAIAETALEFGGRLGRSKSSTTNGKAGGHVPEFERRRLLFSRWPLTWDRWVEFWRNEQEGKAPIPLLGDGMALLAAPKLASGAEGLVG
jgi:hypothetical protein